jgi:hypothetical protein
VTCGKDGQVRLAELLPTGLAQPTRKIAQHEDKATDLAFHRSDSRIILSIGNDVVLKETDIRMNESRDILRVI